MYGSPLFRRMVLWASAAISKAMRINSLSPGFSFGFSERRSERYSLMISFLSCSWLRLYFACATTVSIPTNLHKLAGFIYWLSFAPPNAQVADVAKLVDALDLGSSAARHGGSSPSIRT